MIRISPRLLLCSLLTAAAATFAYAADESAPKQDNPPQQDLPPEILKVLFPEGDKVGMSLSNSLRIKVLTSSGVTGTRWRERFCRARLCAIPEILSPL